MEKLEDGLSLDKFKSQPTILSLSLFFSLERSYNLNFHEFQYVTALQQFIRAI